MPFDRTQPVLVIDDSQVMTRILRELLHQIGFADVDVATSPQAGLGKLVERRFGLVICDWFLPPYTGADLRRAMQQRADLATIPVLLITTQSNAETAGRSGVDLGAMAVKPFNAATLAAKIDALSPGATLYRQIAAPALECGRTGRPSPRAADKGERE